MLTDAQLSQLDAIDTETGLHVLMVTAERFYIVDADQRRVGRDEYTSHEAASLALINGTYTVAPVRCETCVQHGAKNRPQWAKARGEKVNVTNGGAA